MDVSVVRCLASVVSAVVRVIADDFPPLGLARFDPSGPGDKTVTTSDGIT